MPKQVITGMMDEWKFQLSDDLLHLTGVEPLMRNTYIVIWIMFLAPNFGKGGAFLLKYADPKMSFT